MRMSVVLGAGWLCSIASSQINSWLNPVSGQWNVASNWSLGLPQNSHDIQILGTGYETTIPGSTFFVRSVWSEADLRILSGGRLTALASATNSFGKLTLTGGTLDTLGAATLGSLDMSAGTITGAGALTVDGIANLSSSTLKNINKATTFLGDVVHTGGTVQGGPFTLAQGRTWSLSSATIGANLTNHGTVLVASGSTGSISGLQNNGLMLASSGSTLTISGSTSTPLQNNGVIRADGGTVNLARPATRNQLGSFDLLNGGVLRLTSTLTNTGSVLDARPFANNSIWINSGWLVGGSLLGSRNVRFTNAILENVTIDQGLDLDSESLTVYGQVTGLVEMRNSTLGLGANQMPVSFDATLSNSGVSFSDQSPYVIDATSDWIGDFSVSGQSASLVTNNGRLLGSGQGARLTLSSSAFTNNGLVAADDGVELRLNITGAAPIGTGEIRVTGPAARLRMTAKSYRFLPQVTLLDGAKPSFYDTVSLGNDILDLRSLPGRIDIEANGFLTGGQVLGGAKLRSSNGTIGRIGGLRVDQLYLGNGESLSVDGVVVDDRIDILGSLYVVGGGFTGRAVLDSGQIYHTSQNGMTLRPGVVVEGNGTIGAQPGQTRGTLRNEGIIRTQSGTMTMNGDRIVNVGLMEATSNGELLFLTNVAVENLGELRAIGPNAGIARSGTYGPTQLYSGSLLDGAYFRSAGTLNLNGATLDLSEYSSRRFRLSGTIAGGAITRSRELNPMAATAVLNNITLDEGLTITSDFSTTRIQGSFVPNGEIAVVGSFAKVVLDGSPTVSDFYRFENDALVAGTGGALTIGESGTFWNPSRVDTISILHNHGHILTHRFTQISGRYSQSSTGKFTSVLSGTGEQLAGRLWITNNVQLAGSLEIALAPGFVAPEQGAQWYVLRTGGTLTGWFTNFVPPQDGRAWSVREVDRQVVVSVAAVPEPSSIAALSLGLLALYRRRRVLQAVHVSAGSRASAQARSRR